MKILVTGGAGYIGSHTVVELIQAGHEVVIVDNLSNSNPEALKRLETITQTSIPFYQIDIQDKETLDQIFKREKPKAIIHFAGLKAVGESVKKPLEYYQNNIAGTLTLLEVMRKHDVKNIIFSSSATVYGQPEEMPLTEQTPKGLCTNSYGWSKWMIEQILTDMHTSDPSWNVMLLRYFNPIGAHESGLIGEDPKGIPNNLLPYVAQVAVGRLKEVGVFGNDYPTIDGTGVRDYIHVVDLAKGHVAALNKMAQQEQGQVSIYNLGTGKGSSVLEVIHAFEKACGHPIPYTIKPRRAGDIAECYANCDLAKKELGWSAQYDLDDMCASSWKWQSQNPEGYH
ncbi:MAG: UDP-glucose 4-epimerase GalE [Allobaculum sp.]|nr:UDP-glucose 4-epimerase GalE [Allobaculum sp.]